MLKVCVFCGSNKGFDPAYTESAKILGQALAQSKATLVYGGGAIPVGTGVPGVCPGQWVGSSRAHNPKVAGSNPAPATKKTLGIPTFLRVFSRLE